MLESLLVSILFVISSDFHKLLMTCKIANQFRIFLEFTTLNFYWQCKKSRIECFIYDAIDKRRHFSTTIIFLFINSKFIQN